MPVTHPRGIDRSRFNHGCQQTMKRSNLWRVDNMTAVLTTVLTLFVALVGPNGSAIYVAPSQIVAVIGSPGVGACPTTLITMSQPVYVCESPAEVKRKLEESSAEVSASLRP